MEPIAKTTITIGDVLAILPVSRGQLGSWIARDVIQVDPADERVARRFDREDVIAIAVVAELVAAGLDAPLAGRAAWLVSSAAWNRDEPALTILAAKLRPDDPEAPWNDAILVPAGTTVERIRLALGIAPGTAAPLVIVDLAAITRTVDAAFNNTMELAHA